LYLPAGTWKCTAERWNVTQVALSCFTKIQVTKFPSQELYNETHTVGLACQPTPPKSLPNKTPASRFVTGVLLLFFIIGVFMPQ
jgi:hypothetical protein